MVVGTELPTWVSAKLGKALSSSGTSAVPAGAASRREHSGPQDTGHRGWQTPDTTTGSRSSASLTVNFPDNYVL